jgi:hypothetical protein
LVSLKIELTPSGPLATASAEAASVIGRRLAIAWLTACCGDKAGRGIDAVSCACIGARVVWMPENSVASRRPGR